MKKDLQALLKKGQRALKAAENLHKNGDYDFAASRAYYAMFYVAEAALLTLNLAASRHSAVLTLFYEHFVKTGRIEKALHQDLHHAFDLRQQGDYWADSGISREMTDEILRNARRFITTVGALI